MFNEQVNFLVNIILYFTFSVEIGKKWSFPLFYIILFLKNNILYPLMYFEHF